MTTPTFTLSSVHCPHCGQLTIVEYKPTVYHCLNCDFEKDLTEGNSRGLSKVLQFLVGSGGTILLALVLL